MVASVRSTRDGECLKPGFHGECRAYCRPAERLLMVYRTVSNTTQRTALATLADAGCLLASPAVAK